MQFAIKQTQKRVLGSNLIGEEHSPKVLFVAPSSNGQLQIAKYFWSFYRPESFGAEFAALENSPVNPFLNKAMEDYGFTIEQKQIASVFMLSTTCKNFGSIVTLGGFQGYSTLSPFMDTLEILFGKSPQRVCWEIPDPEQMTGSHEEMLQYAVDIRDRIEFEMAQFAQSLEEISE